MRIFEGDEPVYAGTMPYVSTFGDVPQGLPLLYLNSVDDVALAINWGNFAETHGIGSGPEWRIEVAKRQRPRPGEASLSATMPVARPTIRIALNGAASGRARRSAAARPARGRPGSSSRPLF